MKPEKWWRQRINLCLESVLWGSVVPVVWPRQRGSRPAWPAATVLLTPFPNYQPHPWPLKPSPRTSWRAASKIILPRRVRGLNSVMSSSQLEELGRAVTASAS
jgi:hypothetical protein